MTKSAKEVFEELGYKKLPKRCNKNYILYETILDYIEDLERKKKIIWFSLSQKAIQFSPYHLYSIKELKAIIKQIEELRWNND